jgi:tetratricopeptide (TPR) repeat protein
MNRWGVGVVVLVGLLGLADRGYSQTLDAEVKTPYLWRVVCHVAEHPALGEGVRQQIERDILAALQPALGPLGTVEVVDLSRTPREKWEPLWQQYEDKGFAGLEAVREVTGIKTHFLRIDYGDGVYYLRARQHDGFTGLVSPLRQQRVPAAEWLGRAAGLMLEQDFGLCGTIERLGEGNADTVTVVVRGGQLGSWERWVKVGDVFAVAQVFQSDRPAPPPLRTATGKLIAPSTPQSVSLTANPRAYTYLRVNQISRDGRLTCTVLSAYRTPLPTGRALGYRCLKLGTRDGPVVIRLVSNEGSGPRVGGQIAVRANESGFQAPPAPRDTFLFQDGLFRSQRPYAHLACVVISMGPGTGSQFPVPILTDEVVTLPFEADPKRVEAAAVLQAVMALVNRVADARNAQTVCFQAVSDLIKREKNAEALIRAKAGHRNAQLSAQSIAEELERWREQLDKSAEARRLVTAIEQHLAALNKANEELGKHIKTLEAVVAQENDPKALARDVQAQALAARITILLGRGDVEEALNAYEQLLSLVPDNADVRNRRDKLRQEWQPKGPSHTKARDYLLKTWPGVATVADFRDSLPQLGTAVEECMKHDDHYTLRKLLHHFNTAVVKLNELHDALDPNREQDRKEIEQIKQLGANLAALEKRVQDYLARFSEIEKR